MMIISSPCGCDVSFDEKVMVQLYRNVFSVNFERKSDQFQRCFYLFSLFLKLNILKCILNFNYLSL